MLLPPPMVRPVLRVLAFAITAAGVLATVGHMANWPALYTNPGGVRMAFNTAACFVMIGFSFLLIARDDD